jgi:hypothetical protein
VFLFKSVQLLTSRQKETVKDLLSAFVLKAEGTLKVRQVECNEPEGLAAFFYALKTITINKNMLQGLAHFYADDQRRNSAFPGRGGLQGE